MVSQHGTFSIALNLCGARGRAGGDTSKCVKSPKCWKEQKPSIRACLKGLCGVGREATTEGEVSHPPFLPATAWKWSWAACPWSDPEDLGSPSLAARSNSSWCKLPGLLGQPCSPPRPSDYPVSCSCQRFF